MSAQPQKPTLDTDATEALVAAIPEVVKESKAGFRTTEFWFTILTSILVVANAIPMPEKYEGIVVAALGGVYAISRGLAKKGVPDITVQSPPSA